MTAPEPSPMALRAEVGVDVSDRAHPKVVLRLRNAGILTEAHIEAARAADFGMQLGQMIVMAAQQALAQAGPKIVTPNGPGGGLFLPNPNAPIPPNGAAR